MYFQNNPLASQKDYLLNFNKGNNKKLIRTTLNTWLSPDIKAKIIHRYNKKKTNNLTNDGDNDEAEPDLNNNLTNDGDNDEDEPDLNNNLTNDGDNDEDEPDLNNNLTKDGDNDEAEPDLNNNLTKDGDNDEPAAPAIIRSAITITRIPKKLPPPEQLAINEE